MKFRSVKKYLQKKLSRLRCKEITTTVCDRKCCYDCTDICGDVCKHAYEHMVGCLTSCPYLLNRHALDTIRQIQRNKKRRSS